MSLIEHLRAMGESNALVNRIKFLKRDTALATAAVYESMFAAEDGSIPTTFQVIFLNHPLLKTIPFKQFSLTDYSILSHVLGQVIYMTGSYL
uniref:Uncharacterized protein n=1 Tax=Helianthus annuus TaxID=4232 RepID=A0A251TAX1_HELAN